MKWLNWVNLAVGLWILTSPWFLDFYSLAPAMWSNVIAGALIIIVSLWKLFGNKISFSSPQTQQ